MTAELREWEASHQPRGAEQKQDAGENDAGTMEQLKILGYID